MVGPVPSPESYSEKLSDEVKDTKNLRIKLPGYKMPVDFDYFHSVKTGTGMVRNKKSTPVINVFGCKSCRWVNTSLCPHRDNGVSHMKPHCNGICSQRLQVPMMLHDEGVRMTGKQMLQVRGYMDADFFSNKVLQDVEAGKRDVNDVFLWEKLKSDILDKMRRQDEGAKLTVKKDKPDPVVYAEIMRNARKQVEGEVIPEDKEEDKAEKDLFDPSLNGDLEDE